MNEDAMTTILAGVSWLAGSCISAELLGYWLHRLLHSGIVGFLSRSHMRHHMVLYGPLQPQRSSEYRDATRTHISLGNIGAEWLVPAVLLIALAAAVFRVFHVRALFQLIYFGTTLLWSFLMFSYLHDCMHVEGFWLERNRWLKHWFISARQRHDMHHFLMNDQGLMNRNFGIGFFLFDRLFGTFSKGGTAFNHEGYRAAMKKFSSVLHANSSRETL
jgi:sterol desaturase/sphingolipid hydroxylase (fatty acid hydroxylase superfamily)